MSYFKLNRNWNGHYAGEIVSVSNHLDGEMVRNRIGIKVAEEVQEEVVTEEQIDVTEEEKAIETAPENKAILSTPKNKRKNVRRK